MGVPANSVVLGNASNKQSIDNSEMRIPWQKLGKYYSGNSNPVERMEVEVWINENARHREIAGELEEIWQDSASNDEWNVDEGWTELSEKLDGTRDTPLRLVEFPFEEHSKINRRNREKRKWSFGIRVAAAVAVLMVVMFSVLMYEMYAPEQQEAVLAMQEVVTEKGQRSQFTLSDGTRVWLNSDSRLEIPAKFTSDLREVHLQGEAYFSVESNPNKPFVIRAGKTVTRVLGTEFNLQAYPDDTVQIVVREGKVAFGSNQRQQASAELTGNQMATLADKSFSVNEVDSVSRFTGWTRGELIFRDTPLKKGLKKLERWYDIEIELSDSALASRTITGIYKEESMTEVLNIIALSVGMRYEKNKNRITFYPK